MSAEKEGKSGQERLVKVEQFAALVPVMSEGLPLIKAIERVKTSRDQKAIIETSKDLQIEPFRQSFQKAEADLTAAVNETNTYSLFSLHDWQRDRNLPISLLWDRLRVEFGVWVVSHSWVLKIPLLSKFPLDKLPKLTMTTEIEHEARRKFEESRRALANAQREAEEKYQNPLRSVNNRISLTERSLKSLVDTYAGSSREMVGLYASVFPEELEKAARLYALNNAHNAVEIKRLRDQFKALINEQANDKNKRMRAAKLYGQWLLDPEKQDSPLEDLQAREFWEVYVAYDVAISCFEEDPSKFVRKPNPPRLL